MNLCLNEKPPPPPAPSPPSRRCSGKWRSPPHARRFSPSKLPFKCRQPPWEPMALSRRQINRVCSALIEKFFKFFSDCKPFQVDEWGNLFISPLDDQSKELLLNGGFFVDNKMLTETSRLYILKHWRSPSDNRWRFDIGHTPSRHGWGCGGGEGHFHLCRIRVQRKPRPPFGGSTKIKNF